MGNICSSWREYRRRTAFSTVGEELTPECPAVHALAIALTSASRASRGARNALVTAAAHCRRRREMHRLIYRELKTGVLCACVCVCAHHRLGTFCFSPVVLQWPWLLCLSPAAMYSRHYPRTVPFNEMLRGNVSRLSVTYAWHSSSLLMTTQGGELAHVMLRAFFFSYIIYSAVCSLRNDHQTKRMERYKMK